MGKNGPIDDGNVTKRRKRKNPLKAIKGGVHIQEKTKRTTTDGGLKLMLNPLYDFNARREFIRNLIIDDKITGEELFHRVVVRHSKKCDEHYLKNGEKAENDEELLSMAFYSAFKNGTLNAQPDFAKRSLAEAIMHEFYLELVKINAHTQHKQTVLDILATNGAQKSEEYRLIANDKIT